MIRAPSRSPHLTRVAPLAVGLIGLAVWAVLAVLAPQPALQGWLIGFAFTSCLCLGALAVVLIHRLTGGRWGEAFAPELEPGARATPILLLFVAPILFGLPMIYPWAADPAAVEPGVHRLYLNPPFFVLRSVTALVGWSLIAWRLPRIEGPRGRLGAGLGLAFHGIAVSAVSVDWLLSIQPSWTSSDVGMDFAVQQLAAAFAFAALQGHRKAEDQPSGDIAGLLLAAIVGLIYLEFMSYLVVWYGDRPVLDVWYLIRARWPWQTLSWGSLAFGVAAGVVLAVRRAIGTHRAVAVAGGCVLAGVLTYQVWLLASGLGAACLVPAVFALIGQGGVWLALTGGLPRARLGTERSPMPRKPLRHISRRDRYPEPPPIERQPLSPEQAGEDDRLEPPGVNTRVVLVIGCGLGVFIAVALTLLLSFYRLETGGLVDPPPKSFPFPRLEASIDPRVVPASGAGPAQAQPPVVPRPAAEPLDEAMRIIAARGSHAYDAPVAPASGRAP